MDASGFLSPTQQMTRALRGLQQWSGLAGISTSGLSSAFAVGGAAGVGFAAAATTLRAGLAGLTTAANLAKDALSWGAELAAEQEQAQVAFTTMLHSGKAATAMLKDLEKFATATPFDFPQVRNAAKSLLGMGIAARDVQPSLKTLGEIASGVGVPLEQLAMVFGQVKTAGRLMTQDMNQFTSAGVALPKALAKELRIAETSVRSFVEKGKVDFRTFQNALVRLAETDFAGGMEKQSKTALGAMSTLKDQAGGILKDLAADLGEKFKVTEWINDLAGFLGYVRENWVPKLSDAFSKMADAFIDAADAMRPAMASMIKLGAFFGEMQAMKVFAGETLSGLNWNDKDAVKNSMGVKMFDAAARAQVFGETMGTKTFREMANDAKLFMQDHQGAGGSSGQGLQRSSGSFLGGLFDMEKVRTLKERFGESATMPTAEMTGLGTDAKGRAIEIAKLTGDKQAASFLSGLRAIGGQGKNFLGALGNVAEDVGFAGGRVMNRFGKRSDIPEQQKTGALVAGSSEAFSKIIDAMTGRDRNSTQKQSLETLKALEKVANSQLEKLGELIKAAGGSVVNAFAG